MISLDSYSKVDVGRIFLGINVIAAGVLITMECGVVFRIVSIGIFIICRIFRRGLVGTLWACFITIAALLFPLFRPRGGLICGALIDLQARRSGRWQCV